MRRGPIFLSLAGLAAAACWGASRPLPAEHADAAVPPRLTSPGGASSAGSTKTADATKATALDLRQFSPLLAEERFSAARALVEDDEPEAAARAVLAVAATESDPVSVARAHFAAARLFERAGRVGPALDAYQRAAATSWPLQGDAEVRAAELLVAMNRAPEALDALGRAPALADERRTRITRARALASLQKWSDADDQLAAVLARDGGADVRFLRAELLRDAAVRASGDERKKTADRALEEVTRAVSGLPKTHDLAVRGAKLQAELRTLGASPLGEPTLEERLAHLSGLVDRNALEEAQEFRKTIALDARDFSDARCRYDASVAKLLSLERKWGEAADQLAASVDKCTSDPAFHAKLLFNAGKYAAADGRDARAVKYYAELEQRYPADTLADDARLRGARSYKDMGAPARFVDLLSRLPEDYPNGDMTMEGALELALYRIERKDWPGAALVLESAVRVVRARDAARGHEFSGCERYFLARTLGEQGKFAEEQAEYEAIVRELPLSYYMLHAYSRLREADPARARDALERGRSEAVDQPFTFPHRPEFERPEFARAIEFLRVSDFEEGRRVLGGISGGAAPDDALLWGMALLYDQAGDAHVSHAIARGKLTDWLAHYPSGNWERPWQIGFPRPYQHIVDKESQATGVPPWFIYGIMREESTFDPSAESPAAAYGLMQLIVPTARVIGQKAGLPYTPSALKQPRVNIALGSRVLASLTKQFPANPWLAIPGYNAGPGRPSRWLRERPDVDFDVWVELIPFRETRRYTKRVLASRAAYAFLYHPEDAEKALVLPRRLTLP